jgi:hypothetical protein
MRAALAAVAAVVLAACSGSPLDLRIDPGVDGEEVLEVPAGAAAALAVTTDAGDVEVVPSSGPGTVRIVARKHAADAEDLAAIRVFAREEGGVLRVGYEAPGVRTGVGVSFAVEAPPGLPLRLRSSAGSILARGFDAGMEARTSAGNVVADGVRGDLDLQSSAGSVSVSGGDGAVAARTSAGNVEVAGRLRGTCLLESGAGNVTASVPADARLRVRARTSAGTATSDFPLAATLEIGSGRMQGDLGDGAEGTLDLRSSAGNVRLRKAP